MLVLLCFGGPYEKTYQFFDGDNSKETFTTTNIHHHACLAIYKNYPFVVEGLGGATEIMKENGWEASIALSINNLRSNVCFSVDDGVIALMGFDNNGNVNSDVHLLKDDQWKIVGQTITYQNAASVFNAIDRFYIISGATVGSSKFLGVQKFNWNGDSVTDSEIIHTHQETFFRPALFVVQTSSFCVL
ncbi:Oidioi.mRNA.OKI2018_I69.PAR.g8619.t1.cds [Oikopleura dioica]|uniref:Oidioi.mRNA.OKI2018_I69.PAR.g8619.t1.cds n=1 Tax=Oikopleura dioica TaxID=34765 RepID=A0ABN7RP94_OIKDI|nr:Oidioi.mRNA.OKI2018_I69.PAR.g8619.t1.cds [Oikopleura dioica]